MLPGVIPGLTRNPVGWMPDTGGGGGNGGCLGVGDIGVRVNVGTNSIADAFRLLVVGESDLREDISVDASEVLMLVSGLVGTAGQLISCCCICFKLVICTAHIEIILIIWCF